MCRLTGSNFRSDGDHRPIGLAARVIPPLSLLQDLLDHRYAACRVAGWAGHLGNVG